MLCITNSFVITTMWSKWDPELVHLAPLSPGINLLVFCSSVKSASPWVRHCQSTYVLYFQAKYLLFAGSEIKHYQEERKFNSYLCSLSQIKFKIVFSIEISIQINLLSKSANRILIGLIHMCSHFEFAIFSLSFPVLVLSTSHVIFPDLLPW